MHITAELQMLPCRAPPTVCPSPSLAHLHLALPTGTPLPDMATSHTVFGAYESPSSRSSKQPLSQCTTRMTLPSAVPTATYQAPTLLGVDPPAGALVMDMACGNPPLLGDSVAITGSNKNCGRPRSAAHSFFEAQRYARPRDSRWKHFSVLSAL